MRVPVFSVRPIIFCSVILLVLQACSGSDDPSEPTPTPQKNTSNACNSSLEVEQFVVDNFEAADPLIGGRLYDNWVGELGVSAPNQDQPLWEYRAKNPATQKYYNTQPSAASWRCKECHGWDYLGRDGLYNQTSSHYTGFPGLFPAPKHRSALSMFCMIRDGEGIYADHQFSSASTGSALSDSQVLNLVKFLLQDTIDTSNIISSNGSVTGNASVGQQIFSNTYSNINNDPVPGCGQAACHGSDGMLNADGKSLGTLAEENPWEVLHKIRFGHPGSAMPSFTALLSAEEIKGMLAYAQQQLPKATSTTQACHDQFGATIAGDLALVDAWDGGALYDKWWPTNNPPSGDHPLWATQNSNNASGLDTWRCKECHGWDYKGDLGAYGTGSMHYTGFPGVFAARSKTPIDVFCAIRDGEGDSMNPQHVFNEGNTNGVLDKAALLKLTKFIIGQDQNSMQDPALYIDNTGAATGDSQAGAALYNGKALCGNAGCHGGNGTSNVPAGMSLGDLATENPWEVLHKIRFGNPTTQMPSFVEDGQLYELTDTEIKDVLTYVQGVPSANPSNGSGTQNTCQTDMAAYVSANIGNASSKLGGLLYDNWAKQLNASVPGGDHPLWQYIDTTSNTGPANTTTGSDTWRCKECHGWDYKGLNGNYGVASAHYTGFPGVLTANTKTAIEVFCSISLGTTTYPDHNFSGLTTLSDANILDLTRFVTDSAGTGVFDSASLIDTSGTLLNADATVGATSYSNRNCQACHGVNGNLNAGGSSLGVIARDNPWEMLHKVRYGQPGTTDDMPAFIFDFTPALSNGEIINIMAHAQTLP